MDTTQKDKNLIVIQGLRTEAVARFIYEDSVTPEEWAILNNEKRRLDQEELSKKLLEDNGFCMPDCPVTFKITGIYINDETFKQK